MTDLNRFQDMLDGVGQKYNTYVGEDIQKHSTGAQDVNGSVHTVLKCKESKHEKVVGYPYFFTCFYFDVAGAYLGMGCFE